MKRRTGCTVSQNELQDILHIKTPPVFCDVVEFFPDSADS
jgi:hypothetical protein